MKIINKLTWRHLWANKKRTVITLFGIIISVAMVTAVFTSVESLMNTMGEITASYDGAWHAKYNELKSKDVQTLAKQKNVKAIGLSMDLGEISSKADSDSSKSRTDVLACNQNLFTIYSMKPATGRLPVTARELLVPIFLSGKRVYDSPTLPEIQAYCRQQVDTLWDEVKRFDNPHKYVVDLSRKLWDIQQELLRSSQR